MVAVEVETDELVEPVEVVNDIDISLRKPSEEISIVDFVNVKAEVVDLRTTSPASPESRQPKAIDADSGKLNQVFRIYRFSVLPFYVSG